MSQGDACKVPAHRDAWVVINRRCNYSAFSGYRRTLSDYSLVYCPTCPTAWRTKAAYVSALPDGTFGETDDPVEKVATEAARDLLRDPIFKEELKAIVRKNGRKRTRR